MSWSPASLMAGSPVLCVGVDPHPAVMEAWGFPDTAAGLTKFMTALVPELCESAVEVVKPQVAFFERHGVAGMGVLRDLIGELREQEMGIIGDAKRGDVGSTMVGYAESWLRKGADFEVDAVTLSPYQGLGALEPALSLAGENGKGVFVLAATSNPEARMSQQAVRSDGHSLAAGVVADLWSWTESHPGTQATHGVVVGATHRVNDYGLALENFPGMPVLAPGFGHQGAALREASALYPSSSPVIAVVARSVLMEGPGACGKAILRAKGELEG